MPIQLGDSIPSLVLTTADGEPTRLDEVASGPAILIFLRHLA
jgi:hypothetical protein